MAIATHRLVFVGKGPVRFRSQDYGAGGAPKLMELSAEECLHRFLRPVVPPHFVRLRHCGLLANRPRQAKLTRCRQLLTVVPAPGLAAPSAKDTPPATAGPAPLVLGLCPACGVGGRRVVASRAPHRGVPP